MPFVDSSQSLVSRLHLSEASPGVLVGIGALVLVAILVMGSNVIGALEGDSMSLSHDDALLTKSADAQNQDASMSAASTKEASSTESSDSSLAAAAQLSSAEVAATTQARRIFVFVSGAVVNPGVYELPSDARAIDALNAAGGFSPEAATDALNLARVLQDGEQLDIPSQEEVDAGAWAAQATPEEAPSETLRAEQAQQAPALININTASEEELQQLPGVGPATASKIVASRESEGAFASIEDLMRVSGIGEKKFAALAELICV